MFSVFWRFLVLCKVKGDGRAAVTPSSLDLALANDCTAHTLNPSDVGLGRKITSAYRVERKYIRDGIWIALPFLHTPLIALANYPPPRFITAQLSPSIHPPLIMHFTSFIAIAVVLSSALVLAAPVEVVRRDEDAVRRQSYCRESMTCPVALTQAHVIPTAPSPDGC